MSPLNILKDHNRDYKIMEFVAAAALIYWKELQGKTEPILNKSPLEAFCEINGLKLDNPIVINVQYFYDEILKHRNDVQMMKIIQSKG